MKYSGNMSFEDIEKAIPLLAKRGAGFRKDIQSLILSIARQWLASGNVAQAAKLMSRITNEVEGYYAQALVNYAQALLGFSWDTKAKAFTYTETKLTAEMVKAISKEPFWEFSPPAEPKATDFTGLLYALLNKNAKAQAGDTIKKKEAKGVKDTVIPVGVVRAIRELLAKEGITEATE